jgi:hypothetical protein
MRVKLALLADSANVSREGKLNLLGIFDAIFARELPTTHPHMHLVLRFEATPPDSGREIAIEVLLVDPTGDPVLRVPGTMQVPPVPTGMTVGVDHVLALANVGFHWAGDHAFHVRLDGRLGATVPLRVDTLAAGQGH